MESLYPFVLAAMNALAPGRDHATLAAATSQVVEAHPPLFRGDEDRTKTAALVIAVEFRESSFRANVSGDAAGGRPRSFCAMQVHESSGGTPALNADPVACVEAGFRLLATSLRISVDHPVAWYARGPRWDTEEARRISRDRVALAKWVRSKVVARPVQAAVASVAD